jgi:hypothetical protein
MAEDSRWQQRFSNSCWALAQLETFLEPLRLNEHEQPQRMAGRNALLQRHMSG